MTAGTLLGVEEELVVVRAERRDLLAARRGVAEDERVEPVLGRELDLEVVDEPVELRGDRDDHPEHERDQREEREREDDRQQPEPAHLAALRTAAEEPATPARATVDHVSGSLVLDHRRLPCDARPLGPGWTRRHLAALAGHGSERPQRLAQSSIGPVTPATPRAAGARRRRGAAGRRARAQARARAPAAREARNRPDRARHPPRPHGRAAQAARLPGRRPRRRPDHRRLHRAGRRPERPLRAAADADRRGDRGQRPHLPGAGVQGARPRSRAARAAAQQRVARHGHGVAARPRAHRRPSAS